MLVEFGDPRLPPRFWAKAQIKDGCWLWTGAKAGPGEQYGYINIGGKIRRSHRVAYEALIGPIPPDRPQLDHLCRVRACVNPAHLEPVTNRENALRGESPQAQAARRSHCPKGHEYTPANTRIFQGKRQCRRCKLEAVKAVYNDASHWRDRLLAAIPQTGEGITIAGLRTLPGLRSPTFNSGLKALVASGEVLRSGRPPKTPYRFVRAAE